VITAAVTIAVADCIESPCGLAIISWKLLGHIHGDTFMMGCCATAYVTEWVRHLARCM